jgi:hypothetical protein
VYFFQAALTLVFDKLEGRDLLLVVFIFVRVGVLAALLMMVVRGLLPLAFTKRPVTVLRATVLAALNASATLMFPAAGGVLIDLYFMPLIFSSLYKRGQGLA